MTVPRPLHRPPIQAARYGYGSAPQARSVAITTRREAPPPPTRINQRPVILDHWGRTALAGNHEDRAVVSAQTPSFGMSPIGCLIAGVALAALASS